MNITLLASEIASKIPEMSRDSQINNADLIQNLIRQEMEKLEKKVWNQAINKAIHLCDILERHAEICGDDGNKAHNVAHVLKQELKP